MRIGVVTTSFPRWPGDPAGGFVAEHVAWLEAAGHRVEVVAAGERPGRAESVVRVGAGGSLFYAGGAPEALVDWRRWPAALGFGLAQAAEVARRMTSWDGVFAHWLVPSAIVAATLARARRRSVPVVALAHSGDVHLLRRTHLTAPVAALLAGAATTVFVTGELRDRFCTGLPAPLAARFAAAPVCSMGVDVARLARARAAAPARSGPATVLFLGRLVPVKGVEVAIAAAARWRDPARLIVAGDGPCAPALAAAARAAGRVELVGEVRGAERDRLLAGADLLVLPSVRVEGGRTEGLPVAALEAMAAGVPVVASRVGGLAELPAAALRLVPPGDPEALAAAVDQLLGDPEAARRQIAAARALVAGRDWDVVGPRLLSYMSP